MGKTVGKIAALAIMLFNFAGFIEDTRMKEEVRQIRTQMDDVIGRITEEYKKPFEVQWHEETRGGYETRWMRWKSTGDDREERVGMVYY